eukprot:TRINITY_DN3664_c0_g2_i1.p1 TRINITY_DN3664_c0_g2~~TRINITY_DN3664_c0_g2_i1.p1  ORF type:complete len:183 (-),score=3.20 TRINITY_DN3664_c0_g2_i1:305-832(-)
MAFDRRRKRVIAGGYRGLVQVRDEETGKLIATMHHPSIVSCFKYDERREILVTGCNDSKTRVWDLRNVDQGEAKLCCILSGSHFYVHHIDCDEDMIVMTNSQSDDHPCTWLWDFRDIELGPSSPSSTVRSREIILLSAALVGSCFLGANTTYFPYIASAASTAVVTAVLWSMFSR